MLRTVRLSFVPLFRRTKINVNSFRWCSTKFDYQIWSESLDEPKQKRIRHIQSEVRDSRLQLI